MNQSPLIQTSYHASRKFIHLHCIDNSICVAADNSTTHYRFYKLTTADFLGGYDTA